MKYFVKVGDEELEITLEGGEIEMDGVRSRAVIADVEGTPV
ncbi:MAG: hypothetical protein JWL95_299, partial [Gemmatimonadetes bacterium]|nr:hypothetical protein [Gemmatimonadota bacterium]